MAFDLSIIDDFSNRQKTLIAVSVIGFIATVFSLLGPNPFLCVLAFVALYCIIRTLYISKYLTGFLLAFIYQWFQVSIKVLYATFTFKDVLDLTQYPENFVSCYISCTLGLILITFVISLFLNRLDFDENWIEDYMDSINVKKLFISYFIVGIIASLFPISLYQFAVQLEALKWGLFFILFIRLYHSPNGKWIIFGLILFEFVQGIASYFSTWKTIVFYAVISLLSIVRLTPRKIIGLSICAIFVIYFGLLWTGVKGDYRTYISQGNKQVMMVSNTDAYVKMIDLAGNFELNDKVAKTFIDRVSYVDYFSKCMSHVPSVVPHENGQLTLDAIQHVLVPRFLNPNKKVIDESTHLTKYTGVFFSNLSMGVSFSLGYFGDLYVDYGIIGMFIALLIYGILIGFVFKDIFCHISNPLIAIAVMQVSFVLLYKFEISLIKLTGTVVVFWILYRLLAAFVFPRFTKWLME